MAYYFMLSAVPLPIPPSALEIKTPSMNKTVTLINDGEINIPKDRGLREISFEFLLPTVQNYPFAMYQLGSYTATAMIPLLNWWKTTKYPIQFIVVRMSPAGKFLYFTNIKCLIEDFTYNEDAEEHGLDTMCSITLKEYKPYGTKRVKLKEATSAKPGSTKEATVSKTRDTSSKSQPSKITTKKSETIITGARKTGDGLRTTLDANNIKIPDSIANPTVEGNSWMEELSLDINVDDISGAVQNDKTMQNLDSYIEYMGGNPNPWDQGRPELSSLADAVMQVPTKTTYARPTPPPNYDAPALGNGFSEFMKLNKFLIGL